MTILVFGRSGQLARELEVLGQTGCGQPRLVGSQTCDLSRQPDIDGMIADSGATAVINAAAYTRVDQAEEEVETAYALNRDAPAAMAGACARRGLPFVHISTDYVFDGEKGGDYLEEDERRPLNVYGASKASGEDAVRAAGGRHAILRTSWLFSGHGGNFLKTMVRRAAAGEAVSVVADQRGRPSWAADIARAALAALARLREPAADPIIVHVAGDRALSWADFADLIFAERRRAGRRPPRCGAYRPPPTRRRRGGRPTPRSPSTGRGSGLTGGRRRSKRPSLA